MFSCLFIFSVFLQLGAFLCSDRPCLTQCSPLLTAPPVGLSGRKVFQLTRCFVNVNMHRLLLSHGCLLSPPVCHVASGGSESIWRGKQNILTLLFRPKHRLRYCREMLRGRDCGKKERKGYCLSCSFEKHAVKPWRSQPTHQHYWVEGAC